MSDSVHFLVHVHFVADSSVVLGCVKQTWNHTFSAVARQHCLVELNTDWLKDHLGPIGKHFDTADLKLSLNDIEVILVAVEGHLNQNN